MLLQRIIFFMLILGLLFAATTTVIGSTSDEDVVVVVQDIFNVLDYGAISNYDVDNSQVHHQLLPLSFFLSLYIYICIYISWSGKIKQTVIIFH